MPPSPVKNNIDSVLIEQFNRELSETTEVIEKLLDQVQEGQVEFAAVKTELRILCEEVRRLSSIIRGDNGISIVTRQALVEQKMEALEQLWQEKRKEEKEERKSMVELSVVKTEGQWKLYSILVTGIIGIVGSIISIIGRFFQ